MNKSVYVVFLYLLFLFKTNRYELLFHSSAFGSILEVFIPQTDVWILCILLNCTVSVGIGFILDIWNNLSSDTNHKYEWTKKQYKEVHASSKTPNLLAD